MDLTSVESIGDYFYWILAQRSIVRLPTRLELRQGIAYILINFAAPLTFYVTFRWLGMKPAIALAVGVTGIQLLAHSISHQKPSLMFVIASGFTLGFGTIDLWIQHPRFFRLEPFLQNIMIGTVFLATLFTRLPLAALFIRSLPYNLRTHFSGLSEEYLKKATLAWAIYLYLKAAVFYYLAFHVDLAHLVVLRSVIGGGTLFLMFVGEVALRRRGRGPEKKHST